MSSASGEDLGWPEQVDWRTDADAQPEANGGASIAAVARAVHEGLTADAKWLPPWLLYDARGSALFERITRLPEYYLTRLETSLLETHAATIVRSVSQPSVSPESVVQGTAGGLASVIELGAGSAKKTKILLAAIGAAPGALTYYPVDVSEKALRSAVRHLARALPALSVTPIRARYPQGLGFVAGTAAPRLVVFLGSNIGNYEPDEAVALLTDVRHRLQSGDALLLGADLRKDPSVLVRAYDDTAGVTAAFTKNVLVRLNRELGADFDPAAFQHVAEWNDDLSRIDLYLESLRDQAVSIRRLDLILTLRSGERIHVESSHKFSRAAVLELLQRAGVQPQQTWLDARHWYGLTLARVPAQT